MEKTFGGAMFGYNKVEVEEYIRSLSRDYEEQLSLQKDRILDLNDKLRELKGQHERMQTELDEYRARERAIAQTMIHSAEKARMIEEESIEHSRLIEHEIDGRRMEYQRYVADKWTLLSGFENAMQQMVATCQRSLETLKASSMFTDLPRLADAGEETPADDAATDATAETDAVARMHEEMAKTVFEENEPEDAVADTPAGIPDNGETPIWNRIIKEAVSSTELNTEGLV